MAVTENTYTGNGSTVLYSFTFPYLESTDIKVSLNGVNTTAYTLANATTVQFNSAPANGVAIRIFRETDSDNLSALFYPGSAIRSQDLNDNFTQTLYVSQETARNVAQAVAGQIPDGSIGTSKLTNGAVTDAKVTSVGSPKVTFTQAGTGAVQRTVESKLQDMVSVKDFGAIGNGIADDTAAFNAAIAYANAKGGNDRANIIGTTIFIPEGRYRITSPLSPITVSAVHFRGASKASSVLLCTSITALFTFGDSTLTNLVVGGGVSDVKIEYPSGPIGAPVAFSIDYAFSLVFQDLLLENIGMLLSLGQSATRIAGGITVRNVQGSIGNSGIALFDLRWGAGLFVSDCQIFVRGVLPPVHPASMTTLAGTHVFKMSTGFWDTMQVTNCLFERFDMGISATAGSGMVYQNCKFANVIFDYLRRWAVYAEAAGGILTSFRFDPSCWFVSWETAALLFTRSSGLNDNHVISGFIPIAGIQGISYSVNNAKTNIFKDLTVNGCNRLGTANAALLFQAGSTGFSVINAKGNTDTSMSWSRPNYGIVVAANCDEYIITSCALQGPVGGYSFAANSGGSVNRRAFNNINATYAGISTVAVPASGVRYTNTSPFVEEWNFFGGTITGGYDKNNQGFPGALQYVHMRLQPGDNFSVGYSVAPSAQVFVEP